MAMIGATVVEEGTGFWLPEIPLGRLVGIGASLGAGWDCWEVKGWIGTVTVGCFKVKVSVVVEVSIMVVISEVVEVKVEGVEVDIVTTLVLEVSHRILVVVSVTVWITVSVYPHSSFGRIAAAMELVIFDVSETWGSWRDLGGILEVGQT